MRRLPFALLAAAALLAPGVLPACGSSDDAPPPASTAKPKTAAPQTYDDFAEQYAAAYCAAATPCCQDKGSTTDQDGCTTASYQQLALARTTVGDSYDKTKGASCISKLKALAGKSTACDTLDKGIDDCLGAAKVTPAAPTGKAPGEVCASSDDCAPQAQGEVRCQEVGLDATLKKICQNVLPGTASTSPCVGDTRQTLAVNEDAKLAVGTVYRCGDGLLCDSSSRNCVPSAAAGAACSFSFECTKDTFCDKGKCTAAAADGLGCADDDGCLSTSFCTSKGVCAPYVAPGGSCTGGADSRCLDGACVNGKCSVPDGGAAGGSQLVCY